MGFGQFLKNVLKRVTVRGGARGGGPKVKIDLPGRLPDVSWTPQGGSSIQIPPARPKRRGKSRRRGPVSWNISQHGLRFEPTARLTWIGPGERFAAGKYVTLKAMVYLWMGEGKIGGIREPSAIARQWEADQTQIGWGKDLTSKVPRKPSYEKFSPGRRATYLKWIVGGRRRWPADEGFVRLFLYGMERRLLGDPACEPSERALLIAELIRLLSLSPDPSSPVSKEIADLLWHLVATRPRQFDAKAIGRVAALTTDWNEMAVTAALAWYAGSPEPLEAAVARRLVQGLPKAKKSVVASRVPGKLAMLFDLKFEEAFGPGLRVLGRTRQTKVVYKPLNPGLPTMKAVIPALSQMTYPERIVRIWNECLEELRKLSRMVRQEGEPAGELVENSPEAWEALPEALRGPHPWAATLEALKGVHPGRAVWETLQVEAPTGVAAGRKLATGIEQAGYGIEPDPRLSGRGFDEDAAVALFALPAGEALRKERYVPASLVLRMGLSVAAADGAVSDDEAAALDGQIETSFELNAQEVARLEALTALLRSRPVETLLEHAPSPAKLRRLPEAQRRTLADLVLLVAGAEGGIHAKERAVLEPLLTALGLTAAEISQRLTAQARREPLVLDPAAIEQILAQTREVSRVLAEAMDVDEDVETPADEAEPAQTAEAMVIEAEGGLEPLYARFLEAIRIREAWTAAEVAALAQQHGLMLGAAVEAINDWSFEQHGAAVLYDEGETLYVEQSLLQ